MVCKDDSGYITQLKQQKSQRLYYLPAHRPIHIVNVLNFGLLTAEICWRVWGTPANFNGFRVLAALLHGTLVSSGRQPNFAALNRGRHLYSSGRPSGWALLLFVMVTLWNRADHYIFILFLLSSSSSFFFFFPRLISAVGDWMFTILWHMVWP